MITNFSNLGFDSNSNFYNPDQSNHSDFSWQAQAMGNYAPQYHELHHPEYPQFDHQCCNPSSYNYPEPMSSLEDTLKAFIPESNQNIQELNQTIQESSQAIQELKNVTISSSQNLQELKQFMHQVIAKMEGEINYLVAKLNGIEEEEFQSQLMAQGHYMIGC